MKAITLHQPWAWAIIHGPKRVENRKWRPFSSLIGKRILIHAGKTFDHQGYSWIRKNFPGLEIPAPKDFVLGAILGSAKLAAVETAHPGGDRWWFGPFGWRLEDVEAWPEPVPCRGQQGLWDYTARFQTETWR